MDQSLPDLSVVVIAHIQDSVGFGKLSRTLSSISENMSPVTLIDNASREPWAVRVRESVESHGGHYVRREVNNLGAARDQALRLSNCALLAFVDADVELPRDWLRTLRDFLADPQNEACWGVASVLSAPPDSKFDRAMALAMSTPLAHLGTSQAAQIRGEKTVSHLATAAVLFRRQSVLEVGGFSDQFSRVGEDLELSYRLMRASGANLRRLVLLPRPIVTHHQDQSISAWTARVFRYGWSQCEVARRHPRHIVSRKLIPFLIGAVGLVSLGAAILGHPMPLAILLIQYVTLVFGVVVGGALVAGALAFAPLAILIVMATHLAYIAGMWAGAMGLCRNPHYSARR